MIASSIMRRHSEPMALSVMEGRPLASGASPSIPTYSRSVVASDGTANAIAAGNGGGFTSRASIRPEAESRRGRRPKDLSSVRAMARTREATLPSRATRLDLIDLNRSPGNRRHAAPSGRSCHPVSSAIAAAEHRRWRCSGAQIWEEYRAGLGAQDGFGYSWFSCTAKGPDGCRQGDSRRSLRMVTLVARSNGLGSTSSLLLNLGS